MEGLRKLLIWNILRNKRTLSNFKIKLAWNFNKQVCSLKKKRKKKKKKEKPPILFGVGSENTTRNEVMMWRWTTTVRQWPAESSSKQRKSLSSPFSLSSASLLSFSSSLSPEKPPLPLLPIPTTAPSKPGPPTPLPATTPMGPGSIYPTRNPRGTTLLARRYSRAGIASPTTNPTLSISPRGDGSPAPVISLRSIPLRFFTSSETPTSVLSLSLSQTNQSVSVWLLRKCRKNERGSESMWLL